VLILGRDIQAPVGVELVAARRADKQVLAYRKNVRRTQAAEAFARHTALDWIGYDAPQKVARLVQVALVEMILSHGPARGLPPVERDMLRGYLERLCHDERGMPPLEEEGGAGGGGVILVPGKDLPLVGDQGESRDGPSEA
jgi:hypothetical protein